jgi:hypothetical protein
MRAIMSAFESIIPEYSTDKNLSSLQSSSTYIPARYDQTPQYILAHLEYREKSYTTGPSDRTDQLCSLTALLLSFPSP